MLEVNLIFEVHCQRPVWAVNTTNIKFSDSRYRVYINDELITERTWIWNNNIFLKENIWINSPKDNQHTLKIEPVVCIPEQAVFTVDNFIVANLPADTSKVNDLEVNFTLR